MKKIMFLISIVFLLTSCGGIKNFNYGEPFTQNEKELFSNIFDEYKARDKNGELELKSYISDNLITITGFYPPPFFPAKFEYKFTKENGKFICRTYVNGVIERRDENTSFNELLRGILFPNNNYFVTIQATSKAWTIGCGLSSYKHFSI